MGQRILVQIADRAWVEEAIYRACILARKGHGEIVCVTMIPAQPLGWLDALYSDISSRGSRSRELKSACLTAEDYGVPCTGIAFHYFSLPHAIAKAAACIDAHIVFASLPRSIVPFWTDFQRNMLRHALTRHGCVLFDRQTVLGERSAHETSVYNA